MLVFNLLQFFFIVANFWILNQVNQNLNLHKPLIKIALRFLFSKYDMATNIFFIT
jgi:hypothetical protein